MTQVVVQFIPDGQGKYIDIRDNGRVIRVLKGKPRFLNDKLLENLPEDSYKTYVPSGSPGSALESLLKDAGITASPSCNCAQYRDLMNLYGVEWCLDNVDTIVGWLKKATLTPKIVLEELVKLALESA